MISLPLLPLLLAAVAALHAARAHPSPPRQLPFRRAARPEAQAPLVSSSVSSEIDDHYIVVLKDSLSQLDHGAHHSWVRSFAADLSRGAAAAAENVRASIQWNGLPRSHIRHVYTKHLRGYAGRFAKHEIERIRESDEVAYVERDQAVHINDVQRSAPWGLSRISHHKLDFDSFNKYPYGEQGGKNVTVYVIDTGINTNHKDFQGRAVWGATIPTGDEDEDSNGHGETGSEPHALVTTTPDVLSFPLSLLAPAGTHCAGIIGGKRYGVAKKAKIVAVKVLRSNGSGAMSDVIKGIEYVSEKHAEDVAAARSRGERHRGSVANMSLGGGRSRTLDRIVDAVVEAGVHFAVAAGNDNQDACNYSPAASKNALTVGASTVEDQRASFSNYGRCVDIFAPGKDITSTWIGSRVASNTISGTSMASPHIAGLLAYKVRRVVAGAGRGPAADPEGAERPPPQQLHPRRPVGRLLRHSQLPGIFGPSGNGLGVKKPGQR
ncbi:MAG: serine protease 1 [Olpidium bornovanus]|uniref:Serine protease 1 n=1 Tax=Olpidium bornovanus TaxID=278681 RepID=A0A8H7ZTI9_9FUNG|nr:MAG: serine protease 1 [Olpidium bornovanus]